MRVLCEKVSFFSLMPIVAVNWSYGFTNQLRLDRVENRFVLQLQLIVKYHYSRERCASKRMTVNRKDI